MFSPDLHQRGHLSWTRAYITGEQTRVIVCFLALLTKVVGHHAVFGPDIKYVSQKLGIAHIDQVFEIARN